MNERLARLETLSFHLLQYLRAKSRDSCGDHRSAFRRLRIDLIHVQARETIKRFLPLRQRISPVVTGQSRPASWRLLQQFQQGLPASTPELPLESTRQLAWECALRRSRRLGRA